MAIKIALVGNPNSGKTTLFNALTGSNQFVGNWPGVTVEKKEGRLKAHEDVIVTDLPGIYSLSPYTPEERVARHYLLYENPDVILNIVDASNLERNLYLTTQLSELGIPVVLALNLMDVVKKRGDRIDEAGLAKRFGLPAVPISALRGEGIAEVTEAALAAAEGGVHPEGYRFGGAVEHALAHIEEAVLHTRPREKQRFYAVKIFERDEEVRRELEIAPELLSHIEEDIKACEAELDDDAESIVVNERYLCVERKLSGVFVKKRGTLSTSEKIDRIVTNRIAALPIFVLVMFLVYFLSVTTVGTLVTDFTNDGLFGEGFHLSGGGAYRADEEKYREAEGTVNGYLAYLEADGLDVGAVREALDTERPDFRPSDAKALLDALDDSLSDDTAFSYTVTDEETLRKETVTATGAEFTAAVATAYVFGFAPPVAADYGVFVPGIPVLVGRGLEALGCWEWLSSLILDGIIGGVGAVLGFVPQILVLFAMLAFLEACGYMSRIAFVLDRLFRKIGLSGKSFIPLLVGTGCSVPGIMASRTIESERDRRMTIITTSFIPCSAKLPFIAMMAGAVFGGAFWVAPVAYFLGIGGVVLSGLVLKRTRLFAGDPAPFVMELPDYHMPRPSAVLRSTWERGWSFIKKAGSIILLSSVVLWFLLSFGFPGDGGFRMLGEGEIDRSLLAFFGQGLAFLFTPLGFGNWACAVATVTGLIAKENIVSTLGIVFGDQAGIAAVFTEASGLAFLVFNLLCAPCFAAVGAIRREMQSGKWTLLAVGYQTLLAFAAAFTVNQLLALLGVPTMGAHPVFGALAILLILATVLFLALPLRRGAKRR